MSPFANCLVGTVLLSGRAVGYLSVFSFPLVLTEYTPEIV